MLNSIAIHGRLCKDPELRTTQSGVNVCTISVAVDRSYAKKGEEKQTDFFDVVCWKNLADVVDRYFHKGKEIIVYGSMQSRKWQDKNGQTRVAWEILASGIDFVGSASDGGNAQNYSAPSNNAQSGTGTGSTDKDFEAVALPDEDLPF